jgi:hypothetical protein
MISSYSCEKNFNQSVFGCAAFAHQSMEQLEFHSLEKQDRVQHRSLYPNGHFSNLKDLVNFQKIVFLLLTCKLAKLVIAV